MIRKDDRAMVCLRDSGVGIAPENLGTVFDMFSQVAASEKRSHGGLGIGLALARGVYSARRHH
ncbi:ATP-binding protein [Paraburkholderia dilworthii]|uniref:ATP-binding protein n=1 Tax=Paraburkholderia dilworthii TaxID=948106 RepID=UPI0012684ED8|nr:ATP-binding protein [Paraburkholderia dilworthii]